MSNSEFSEVDAHKVISISLNKIANFRVQRGGPKLFKDLLVANLIQKAKILVVDEIYSSSRNLTFQSNDSNFCESNLEVENDVFEESDDRGLEKPDQGFAKSDQGLGKPRLEFILRENERDDVINDDDVTNEEASREYHPNKPTSPELDASRSNWDENNKENKPLDEIQVPNLENIDCLTPLKFSSQELVELAVRTANADVILNSVNSKESTQSGLDDRQISSAPALKRKSSSDEDFSSSNNRKKCKKTEASNGDSFLRKWRVSSLSRPSPHRTKHPVKRHRSRDWSLSSFDTDSDDDEIFTELKPFSKLIFKEGHQLSALADASLDNFVANNKLNKSDEEQIANLSTVFSSGFDGLGLHLDGASPRTSFIFSAERVTLETKRTNDFCSKQAKNLFRRASQPSDQHVAVTV